MIPIILSILIILVILFITCMNALDKWRFRADRQYPYVRELMDEWEAVTLRLLETSGADIPPVRVAGQKHPWEAAAAANRLAAACPPPDPANPVTAPILARQGELEEALDVFLDVYNGLVKSFNKTLNRPVVKQMGLLFHWQPWEPLDFNPNRLSAAKGSVKG